MFESMFKSLRVALGVTAPITDPEDPDAPFTWARACGHTRSGPTIVGGIRLHPLSLGGGQPHDGTLGPKGYTDRDGSLIDHYIRSASAAGHDCAGWIVEDTDGEEWQRDLGSWCRV